MPTVAGVDSSTQSTKIVVCDADSGEIVAEASAPHPDGTECPPEAWWAALQQAGAGLLDSVSAIGVAGQQHGLVALDASDEVVRPALLWNDTRSAPQARRLVDELGAEAWAEAVGSVPVASFTVTKLAWMAEHEPELAARVAKVMLPHDYVTWELSGRRAYATDRGDASGTGYWSPVSGDYRIDLLERALDLAAGSARRAIRTPELPAVKGPAEVVGETASGALLSVGTGDNMGAALGLGLRTGQAVVSLGTSGTVFAVQQEGSADPTGIVAGFADATGRFLPLVCTLNAARVIGATARMLGVEPAEFDRLALSAPAGSDGLVLLPYLDGERTPNLPDATGSLHNLTRASMTPQNVARASVEGMLCGLADGLDALQRLSPGSTPVERILLIGGAAKSPAVQAIAPGVFGMPVHVPPPGQYVALGAARQAAWALRGGDAPPDWPLGDVVVCDERGTAAGGPGLRQAYAEARESLHGAG